MAGRLLANAMPLLCFTAVRRQLQHDTPTHIRPYPPRHKNKMHQTLVPPVDKRASREYPATNEIIRLVYSEILALMYR
jgi:hypothetical protein